MAEFTIDTKWKSLTAIEKAIAEDQKIVLSKDAMDKIQRCRSFLDKKVEDGKELIYGVTTGFGSLCNTAISKENLAQLQSNLVRSHACGMGEEVPQNIIKNMLLFKIMGLSHGHSGAQLDTVNRLLHFYNEDILPVIYQQGSLGASGDLAPLAHMALSLIGDGEVYYKGKKVATSKMLQSEGLKPIKLQSKEGLALLNGTQFMSAYAFDAVTCAEQLYQNFTLIGAASLEGFDGRENPFQENVNAVRNQAGQIATAKALRKILEGSEIIAQHKEHVQDPYSFRCMPQVHGASKDSIDYVADVVEKEINAVTDNPTVFSEEDDVVSSGNFHGQPLAIAMDFLAIALAELGSISERRVYKLISGQRGLPEFLVANPGLNSGFMIPQYTAASIVSQNKQLCSPASIDSIDSSNGQEDHVSMGANGATKLYRVVQNCYAIQGIELLNAIQAIEFRRPLKSSPIIEKLVQDFRKIVPFVKEDAYFHPIMKQSEAFVKEL